jgi:hypothetical protein
MACVMPLEKAITVKITQKAGVLSTAATWPDNSGLPA